MLELLKEDPELAETRLKVALEEAHLHGGEQTLLNGLRHLARL